MLFLRVISRPWEEMSLIGKMKSPYVFTDAGKLNLGIHEEKIIHEADFLDLQKEDLKSMLVIMALLGGSFFLPEIANRAKQMSAKNPVIEQEVQTEIDSIRNIVDDSEKEEVIRFHLDNAMEGADAIERVETQEAEEEVETNEVYDTAIIDGKEVQGYYIDERSLSEMREEVNKTLDGIAPWMNEDQRAFFIKFFEEVGLAESVFHTENGLFSAREQINGPAKGYLQIEPETALSVLDQILLANNKWTSTVNTRIQDGFGMSLKEMRDSINDNPNMLDSSKVSMLIMYLKFANRGFKDIPNFKTAPQSLGHKERASVWKSVWNAGGAGSVKGFLDKNEKARNVLGGV